jgi:hypothetical protein
MEEPMNKNKETAPNEVEPVLENNVKPDLKLLAAPQKLQSSENQDLPIQESMKKGLSG